eukprot:snap_masked-scaffold_30-processed-gene-2.16-mRNA-1 protein AED:1.00 eAED:1.00 QI:0/0/0/0/1/1/3/0/122
MELWSQVEAIENIKSSRQSRDPDQQLYCSISKMGSTSQKGIFYYLYKNHFRLAESLLFLNNPLNAWENNTLLLRSGFKYFLFLNTEKRGIPLVHQSGGDIVEDAVDVDSFLVSTLPNLLYEG